MLNRMSHQFYTEVMRVALPMAIAKVSGGEKYPEIKGIVQFYQTPLGGLIVEVEVMGLPAREGQEASFFGFHIHENGDCADNFGNTGNHYNPTGRPHPEHLGDLPVLMAVDGYTWMCFYDANLTISQIMGRSVVIHDKPDDFRTQPAGASGDKIACGVIQ